MFVYQFPDLDTLFFQDAGQAGDPWWNSSDGPIAKPRGFCFSISGPSGGGDQGQVGAAFAAGFLSEELKIPLQARDLPVRPAVGIDTVTYENELRFNARPITIMNAARFARDWHRQVKLVNWTCKSSISKRP